MSTGTSGTRAPSRLRSFDPVRIADLEYRAWVGYYLRRWPQVLAASVGLVRAGFGMDWIRTLHGAWLVLRANQLWAPFPDNDPEGARACMRRFYALVRLSHGEPAATIRPAAVERARAMDLSDQWVREGCQPDSPLLPPEHAALVRSYAALLAAVHHD